MISNSEIIVLCFGLCKPILKIVLTLSFGLAVECTELIYTVHDGVGLITLNRPDRLNAWTPNLEIELRSVIESAQLDRAVRCVVITGAGRAFCAGMDMAVLGASDRKAWMTDAEDDVLQRYGYLFGFDKPLIAAINGAAVGVGLCLALYCDVRFIARGAKVATPYTRRGLVAEHGLAWLLPRLIGPLHTADLLLSGRTIEAQEASQMGMALLRPSEGFLEAVLVYAQDLAASCSPRSVRIVKKQLLQARYQTFGQATHTADREIALCRGTEDFKEGVQHFLEKRPPNFTGQ
jgi:enoyl-CoA hydratase/carnithine racemase